MRWGRLTCTSVDLHPQKWSQECIGWRRCEEETGGTSKASKSLSQPAAEKAGEELRHSNDRGRDGAELSWPSPLRTDQTPAEANEEMWTAPSAEQHLPPLGSMPLSWVSQEPTQGTGEACQEPRAGRRR